MMAGGFVEAVKSIVSYRAKSGTPFDPANVTGGHAATGIGINILVQAALVAVPLLGAPAGALALLPDLALVTLLSLAVPYLVVAGVAAATRRTASIPAAFLFLALTLLLMQLVLFALAQFTTSGSGAGLGALALIVYYACRLMLGLGLGVSVLAGLLAVVGTFAAGGLLLVLPSGQALLNAA